MGDAYRIWSKRYPQLKVNFNLIMAGAQRGQPLLLDAVGIFMGIFMGQKIDLLGCIGTTRNLENQSQNPHWAICLPAIGLRVQPLQEI